MGEIVTQSPGSSTVTGVGDDPNVLQVCTFYYPFTGGIQKIVRSFVTEIEDANFRVLTCRTRGRGSTDRTHDTRVVRAGSLGTVKSTPIAPTFPLELRRQLAWADLVHYHLPFPLGPASHLLNRASETPTVVTFHDDIVGKGPIVKPYQPVFDRFMRGVDRVVVTSPTMRDQCDRIRPYREKAEVVPIGIDATDDEIAPKSLEGRRLLFVGRLVGFKGVDRLISAMRDVDATLSIVGKGPARESLERHAAEGGVADAVRFEGFVSDERLDQLYREASVFVLPSVGRNESFGIVQLEAMQRGLPVINTDLPTGVPWVSLDGETGRTVTPGEPEQLADAAREILSDREQYRRYSENAQRRVREQFTRERMLADTRAVYADVLANEESDVPTGT